MFQENSPYYILSLKVYPVVFVFLYWENMIFPRKILLFYNNIIILWGFPDDSAVKNLPANAGCLGSIPGLGRSPGGGNGNPLQYSYLENPTDRRAWWATVHRAAKSQT